MAFVNVKVNQNATKMLQTRLNALLGKYKAKTAELSKLYAEKFCECAKERLRIGTLDNANGLDYSDRIYVTQTGKNSYAVIVDNGSSTEENIMAFLEYGTGLKGQDDQHPVAKLIGWEYAINEDRYVEHDNQWGWYFNNKGYNYISTSDSIETKETKNGISQKVFSSGIVPLRYIYDTQRQFKQILNLSFKKSKNGKRIFSLESLETRLKNARV